MIADLLIQILLLYRMQAMKAGEASATSGDVKAPSIWRKKRPLLDNMNHWNSTTTAYCWMMLEC